MTDKERVGKPSDAYGRRSNPFAVSRFTDNLNQWSVGIIIPSLRPFQLSPASGPVVFAGKNSMAGLSILSVTPSRKFCR